MNARTKEQVAIEELYSKVTQMMKTFAEVFDAIDQRLTRLEMAKPEVIEGQEI